jgi:ubiquinone/menaquinone biosynthesis C-methylase UbiE
LTAPASTRMVGNVDLDLLGVSAGGQMADVGCGEGSLALQIAGAGVDVIGVEPSQRLRDRFEEKARQVGPGSARVADGVVERLPFDDGGLRAAVITEVLEHVADPAPALEELHRVLAPGGVLCLSVPTSFTELLFWRLHPRYARNATHVRIFTKPELRRLLDVSGFDVVRWEGRNFRPAVSWVFHALLRSESDHTGAILDHHFVDYGLEVVWRLLRLVGLLGPVERLGNRVWPKSWYVYARRR